MEQVLGKITHKQVASNHHLRCRIQEILSIHFSPLSKWASPKKVHDKQVAALNEIMQLFQ